MVAATIITALLLVAAACDGGPPNGELTVQNNTDRPVLMIAGSARNGPINESIRRANFGFGDATGPIGAGQSETFAYTATIADPDGRFCGSWSYWVLTSNDDAVSDFDYPLDADSVTVQQTFEETCFDGLEDSWTIDELPN